MTTSKQRVLTTLGRGQADRVPVNYMANPGIDGRLKKHFGLAGEDAEGLARALGVDFRGVMPVFRGVKRHADIPERGVVANEWGIRRRWVPNDSGGYWEFCDFPLAEATEEQVADWPMPSPDDYDYGDIAERCRQHRQYAVVLGSPGTGDIICGTGMVRGFEQTLIDLITGEPAGLLYMRRRAEIWLEILRRSLEAAKSGFDLLWLGEDLGTQNGPIISAELYRAHVRPLHQRFIDLGKAYGLKVMVHTCGASSWAYEDFIEMGVDAVDTLQPEATDMQPELLKQRFGGRLAFHGCISTAGPVATGSVADVVAYCRRTLEIMMPGGGYCLAPTHQLQDNSPTENVLAMYETARRYGQY